MEAGIFDTHAHYDDEAFDADREALLSSMEEAGVRWIVNASASVDSWDQVVRLTQEYPFVYGMIGVHPDEVGQLNEAELARMERLLTEEKIVAAGEIGLDYYWDTESRSVQKEWFIRQLELARKLDMPVNIHSREAAADTMEILEGHAKGMRVLLHCYSYSPEIARECVKKGYLLGVGGVVTFKNGKRLKETVRETPLQQIVLETDCPYLSPEPYRGKRNSSRNLKYVAEAVAELKGLPAEEVIRVTAQNAVQFYGIGTKQKER